MNDLRLVALSGLLIALPPVAAAIHSPAAPEFIAAVGCDPTIQLPAGFCATVIAESLGPVRHLVVTPNGDVLASLANGRDADRNMVAGVLMTPAMGGRAMSRPERATRRRSFMGGSSCRSISCSY